jgi:transcriptional/translational regulatory protein YebC/TACO1
MFKNKGLIRVAGDAMAEDQLMEVVLEAGAEDMSLDGDEYEIVTTPETYEAVKEALEKINIVPASAELTKIPENTVKVEGENASKVLKLMDALDDLDDTQHVYANFDISDADMEKLQE